MCQSENIGSEDHVRQMRELQVLRIVAELTPSVSFTITFLAVPVSWPCAFGTKNMAFRYFEMPRIPPANNISKFTFSVGGAQLSAHLRH